MDIHGETRRKDNAKRGTKRGIEKEHAGKMETICVDCQFENIPLFDGAREQIIDRKSRKYAPSSDP